jgi:hypothetical protein
MKRPTLALIATILAALPAAAIWVPQTRQEFVQAVSDGKGATAVDKLVVDQPLDKVYPILEERTRTCLDVKVERTANVGYVEHSSTDYNPTLRRIEQSLAEFTLQVVHNPRGVGATPPANGLYIMAADLRSTDDHHTEIVLYRPTMGTKKIIESLKQWFSAEAAPCPKLR